MEGWNEEMAPERGIRKDTGAWVEGYHIRFRETGNEYIMPIDAMVFYGYEIIPGSMCHGMGIPDVTGRQIFEHDILIMSDGRKLAVRWDWEMARFVLKTVGKNEYGIATGQELMTGARVVAQEADAEADWEKEEWREDSLIGQESAESAVAEVLADAYVSAVKDGKVSLTGVYRKIKERFDVLAKDRNAHMDRPEEEGRTDAGGDTGRGNI